MSKLPEHERPPFKDIERRLFDRVSYQLRQFFVLDIQNDCACPVETYDRDYESDVWYLSATESVEKIVFGERVPLPMIPEITDKSILLLLKKACQDVGSSPKNMDVVPNSVLANIKCDPKKLSHVFNKVLGMDISMNRSGIIHGAAFADFVPENEFIIFPEPEFFGCLGANIGGFGAFCISNSLFKYKVNDDY